MFASFYQLQEQPFGGNPDPRYLYMSKTHREVFSSLLYRIHADCGFLAMIAHPGMGKTTLLFHLLNQLKTTARTAFVFQTQCTSNDFLRYLLFEFGSTVQTTDPVSMFQDLKAVLVSEANAGRRCLVLVDEAQNLQPQVLETIRLLSDFETPRRKLLQIILSGQLELEEKLANPALSQLRQRMSSITRITPFETEDVVGYIAHRLKVAGHKGSVTEVFHRAALARIVGLSGGIPRVINNICFNALSLGYAIGAKQVNAAIIDEVALDLGIRDTCCTSPALAETLPLLEIECMFPAADEGPSAELSSKQKTPIPEEEPSFSGGEPSLSECDLSSGQQPLDKILTAVAEDPTEISALPELATSSQPALKREITAPEKNSSGIAAEALPESPALFAEVQLDRAPAFSAESFKDSKAPRERVEQEFAAGKAASMQKSMTGGLGFGITRLLRNAKERFTPEIAMLARARALAYATVCVLLVMLGVSAFFFYRGVERSVQAKSAAASPRLLPRAEEATPSPTAATGIAAEGAGAHYRTATTQTWPASKATALTPAGSSESHSAAMHADRNLPLQPNPPETQFLPNTSPASAILKPADIPVPTLLPSNPSATRAELKVPLPALPMSASSTPHEVSPAKLNFVPPRPISSPPPSYPEIGRSSGVQGDVLLLLSISSKGDVRSAKVLKGPKLLAGAAETAVLHWKYQPGLENGVPVDSHMQVTLKFSLQ